MAKPIVIHIHPGKETPKKKQKKKKWGKPGVWDVGTSRQQHNSLMKEMGIETVEQSRPTTRERFGSRVKSGGKWLREQSRAYNERKKRQEEMVKSGKRGLVR